MYGQVPSTLELNWAWYQLRPRHKWHVGKQREFITTVMDTACGIDWMMLRATKYLSGIPPASEICQKCLTMAPNAARSILP